MNIFARLTVGARRWKKARVVGKKFRGTSWPFPLSDIRIAGSLRTIATPTNTGHWHDFINVILDDEYGLKKISFPPQTIIDLGGNVGMFALWARHCFPGATIHCYEPNPELLPFLYSNLKGLNVEVFPSAVASRSGRGSVSEAGDNRCFQYAIAENGNVAVDSFVDVIDRMKGKIDLLKIDIEGGEWELFLAENQAVFSKINRIVMEYHETSSRKLVDLLHLVNLHGFAVDYILSNRGFGVLWLNKINER